MENQLKSRTKAFALRIIRVYESLPKSTTSQVIGKQVLRSGTSVGAHYREACRARSSAEFISKIEGGLQELEETQYWLELLIESELVSARQLGDLQDEANQIIAMLTASVKTTKERSKPKRK